MYFPHNQLRRYGGGGRTCIREVYSGQRLERYLLSSVVRPCTMLDNELGKEIIMKSSLSEKVCK